MGLDGWGSIVAAKRGFGWKGWTIDTCTDRCRCRKGPRGIFFFSLG